MTSKSTSPSSGKRPARKYSDTQIRRAVTLVNEGAFWSEAAASIGMSEDALRTRARKMQLPVRKGHLSSKRLSVLTMPTAPSDLGYLAALIDGEGHICIENGQHRSVLVGVTNTDRGLLAMLEGIGGKVSWKTPTAIDGRYGSKPCATWQLRQRNDVLDLLTHIEPYMRIKQQKARDAIAIVRGWLAATPEYVAPLA